MPSISNMTHEKGKSVSWFMMPVNATKHTQKHFRKTNNSKKTFPLYLEESQSYSHKQ